MAEFSNPTTFTSTGQAAAIPVAYTDTATRLAFLRKVYALLGGAVTLWAGTALFVVTNETLSRLALSLMTGFMGILIFMVVAFVVLRVTAKSSPLNIIGLSLFSMLMGFATAPLILIVIVSRNYQGAETMGQALTAASPLLMQAFGLTAIVFGGLSAYAFTTKRDFSFLRGALMVVFFTLFGIGVLSMFGIGESLVSGWGWSAAWVLLMSGFILYDTQNIMKRFPANAAASAAAILLWDFVMLFQHILMLLSRGRD